MFKKVKAVLLATSLLVSASEALAQAATAPVENPVYTDPYELPYKDQYSNPYDNAMYDGAEKVGSRSAASSEPVATPRTGTSELIYEPGRALVLEDKDPSQPRSLENTIDPNLMQALINTYQNNERIQSERKVVQATDEFASQAFSNWMPTLFLEGQRGKVIVDRDTIDTNDMSDSVAAKLNVPLFRGGRTLAVQDREKSRITAAEFELKRVEQEVLFDAVESYINTWRDQNLLEFAKQNEEMLKKSLEEAKVRFDLSEITQTDVFQAQTRYTRSISERVRREADMENSRSRFKRITGADPVVTYNYDSPEVFKFFQIEEVSYSNLISYALANNPSILVSEYDSIAAGHDISLKKGALLPTVALNGEIERQRGGGLGLGVDEQKTKSLLVNVSVPLYQNGSEYSQVRQAKRKAEQVKFDLEEKKKLVTQELNTALENMHAALEATKTNTEHKEVAELALKGVTYEAQAGTRTTLDVLDAQQELLEAQTILVRAQHDEFLSAYALLKSLGILTAKDLNLPTSLYDVEQYYNDVKRKPIGF